MRIALACDHRGYVAKERLKAYLVELGHEVEDFGVHNDHSADYPDTVYPAAEAIRENRADRGIMMCGTGIGCSIAANKVQGVRAGLCHDELTASLSRRHNDTNALCLSADLIGEELIRRIVSVWLETPFEGGRHERRINKIRDYEKKRVGG
jgi:ribose 5-phosphate isomerase B